jgi:hypothetical protein
VHGRSWRRGARCPCAAATLMMLCGVTRTRTARVRRRRCPVRRPPHRDAKPPAVERHLHLLKFASYPPGGCSGSRAPLFSDAQVANRNVRGFGCGRSLTGLFRDARRFSSTRWYTIPRATRTTLGFGICPSFKEHSLSRRAKPLSHDSQRLHRCTPLRSLAAPERISRPSGSGAGRSGLRACACFACCALCLERHQRHQLSEKPVGLI